MKKQILTLTLLLTILCPLIAITNLCIAQAGTSVIGIITQDTTWTKTGSPYMLTGPLAVNSGVTLTIETGSTVTLNGFYIQVNGTLIAKGTSTDVIRFVNGTLRFTSVSISWNEETNSGCIIEYADLSAITISASNALKLNQNTISGETLVGSCSVVTGNNFGLGLTVGYDSIVASNQVNYGIAGGTNCTIANNIVGYIIFAGDKSTVTGNTVASSVTCTGNQAVISNNSIHGAVSGGTITNNTITCDGGKLIQGIDVSNNNITGGTISANGSATITNNNIKSGNSTALFRVFGGEIVSSYGNPAITTSGTGSPYIASNNITGGGTLTAYGIFSGPFYTTYAAIEASAGSLPIITNNNITGLAGSAINGSIKTVFNNTITGNIGGIFSTVTNNIIYGEIEASGKNTTITNNFVTAGTKVSASCWNITGNTANGIAVTQGEGVITQNVVTGGKIQVSLLHINTAIGIIVLNATATILNNTITNNEIAIDIYPAVSATIHHNNIQFSNQSIYLEEGNANNVNATYNWWGTTSTDTINQSIRDNKNDFNLGEVSFVPFLTEPNSQAAPNLESYNPITIPTPTPSTTQTPNTTVNPAPTTQTTTTVPIQTDTTDTTAPTPTQTSDSPSPSAAPTDSPAPTQTVSPSPYYPDQTDNTNIPQTTFYGVVASLSIVIAVMAIVIVVLFRKKPLHQTYSP